MRVTGGCHCNEAAHEAEAEPGNVSVCHCRDCQRLTGTAFRTSVPARRAPRLTRGAPRIDVKTAESGARTEQPSCPTRGASPFARPEGGADWGLRRASIDGREARAPSRAISTARRAPWLSRGAGPHGGLRGLAPRRAAWSPAAKGSPP